MVTTVSDLPDDVLADVLRRLAPRSLATCRCVCRPWRDAVDARRLLRADLLPRAVRGIFMEYDSLYHPEFLSRPSTTAPPISGDLKSFSEFTPRLCRIKDHCNGLLLCRGLPYEYDYAHHHYYVVNPATRRWARLPPRPADPEPASTTLDPDDDDFDQQRRQIECLAYDPAVSPHYEAFLIPDDDEPSSKALQAFSSATGRWEERLFVREGRAAGSVADMKPPCYSWERLARHAVYWREALYVLCNNGGFMRMCISNAKYRLVQTPEEIESMTRGGSVYLGTSEKGVYCAFSHGFRGLMIFLLAEPSSSRGDMVWEMRHRVYLASFSRKLLNAHEDLQRHGNNNKGPWMLQDINYYNYQDDYCGEYRHGSGQHDKEAVQDSSGFEWNSDDDDVLDTENMVEGWPCDGYTSFLGFHPYKEVVFLNIALSRAVAYHWNTSKFQDLGDIYPRYYCEIDGGCGAIDRSFPYTPCWMEEFPGNKLE